MIALAYMIVWGAGVAGLVQLVRGWFGPRLDDHPHCRKCFYDLTGLQGGRCPECGASLEMRDAVVSSRRVHRWRQIGCGAGLMLLSLAAFVGWQQWQAYQGTLPSRLVAAARADDVADVSQLLGRGARLSSSLPLEEVALHAGARQVFALLLRRHVRGEVPLCDDGRPMLHFAAEFAHWAVPLLLQHAVPVDARDRQGNTTLIAAMREFGSSKVVVRTLLDAGASAKATNAAGETALHFAYECGLQDLDAIAALLEHGADVNARDASGRTPLHAAMEMRSGYAGPAMMALCDAGADLSAADAEGTTPGQIAHRKGHGQTAMLVWRHRLEAMAKAGRVQEIAKLLDGDNEAVNYGVGGLEGTLLHWAGTLEDAGLAAMLLDHGADANAMDKHGRTPLRSAGPAVCDLLLKRGANPLLLDTDGRTFLQQALAEHGGEKLAMLLSNRPELARSAHVTRHLAMAQHPDRDRMLALLAAGAPHDIFAAIVLGETEIAVRMIEQDPRLARELHDGVPLIIPAIRAKQDEILSALLAEGADANANATCRALTYEEDSPRTPLHEAMAYGRKAAVRMLLDHGADPNARSSGGEMSLHWACWHDEETARWLLESGAEVNARDNRGRTPLHAAAAFPTRIEVVRLLVAAGADITAKDADGRTPGQLAQLGSGVWTVLNAATQPAADRP